jgi:hypothetical protein
MYKFKEAARRGSALFAAVSLLAGIGASAMPALVSADALNPLTERSLLLSSSSPGWAYLDGSNNPTYAPPDSGVNGKQTGETFTFRVSSTATIKALTFQFCTSPAGLCQSPGDDSGSVLAGGTRGNDTSSTSDLAVVTSTPTEVSAMPSGADKVPNRNDSEGNFAVQTGTSASGVAGTFSSGWTMTTKNQEEATAAQTGKKNFITLANSTGKSLSPGDYVKITFYGTDGNYITNPGSGAFFVKINDFNDDVTQDNTTLVDGGVTVANVMNQSIQIQTKVLETMDFSVGIADPDMYNVTDLGASHGQCDAILPKNPTAGHTADPANTIRLGTSDQEYSLSTATPYDGTSYWRLSSNSSGGATVYYSGHTLTNTENDQIAPMTDTTAAFAHKGTEQFGLALQTASNAGTAIGDTYDSTATTGWVASLAANSATWHNPTLAPLVPTTAYSLGDGTLADGSGPKFAFNSHADTVPVAIAAEGTDVVDCVTGKMRYVGDIAATTPAGIYTTKVNYVASPQY